VLEVPLHSQSSPVKPSQSALSSTQKPRATMDCGGKAQRRPRFGMSITSLRPVLVSAFPLSRFPLFPTSQTKSNLIKESDWHIGCLKLDVLWSLDVGAWNFSLRPNSVKPSQGGWAGTSAIVIQFAAFVRSCVGL
jgi:hypothetical protein